jgi:nucleotide-binding universal stress UspA family protein
MKVLLAIDEDCCKDSIVQFVTNREWAPQTHFLVLHVIDSKTENLEDAIFVDDRKAAARLVRKIALAIRDAFRTPYVEEKIEIGRPKEKIDEIAREWGADLTVVGSQGKFLDYLFGSVSESTITKSDCSVLVIKQKASDKSSSKAVALSS